MAGNVNDGSRAGYPWSGNGVLPQWVQADLGSAATMDQVALKLPTDRGAAARH